jgi:hypothetical protein
MGYVTVTDRTLLFKAHSYGKCHRLVADGTSDMDSRM